MSKTEENGGRNPGTASTDEELDPHDINMDSDSNDDEDEDYDNPDSGAGTEELTAEMFQMALEEAREKKDPSLIQTVFEKFVNKFPDNAEVWHSYGHWAETELKIPSVAAEIYDRALQACPEYYTLWQQALTTFERARKSAEELDQYWANAKEIGITDDPLSGFSLYRTYIYLLRRRITANAEAEGRTAGPQDYAKVVEIFEEGDKILREYFGQDWDPLFEYRKMQAQFYASKMREPEKAAKIWEDILASGAGRNADKWIEAANLLRAYGTNLKLARKFLTNALNSVSDHPEQIFKFVIQFEREEGTLEELDLALQKVNNQSQQRAKRPQKKVQEQKSGPPKKQATPTKKWDKREGKEHAEQSHSAPAPRRRDTPFVDRKRPAPELLEMKEMENKKAHRLPPPSFDMPKSPAEKDKDGFVMPSLPVKKGANFTPLGPEIPRQSTSESMEISQENGEDGRQKPTSKWAVFVSNLDFKITEEQIKEALEGVVAVRFNFRGGSKLHKGYAFVDLDSERHFRSALAKDRTPLDGRPMFISENDPNKRVGFKYDAGLEKNKLFVRNVHIDATEDQLRDLFTQFGPVKSTRIVTFKSGVSKGIAYVDMGNEKDAKKAVDAEELVLLEKQLTVLLSNPPKKGESSGGRPKSDFSGAALGAHAPQQAGQRKGHASMIQLVPRNIAKKAGPGGSIGAGAGKKGEGEKMEQDPKPLAPSGERMNFNGSGAGDAKNSEGDDEHLLAPFQYIRSMPGKQIRSKLAKAFNFWLRIDDTVLNQIMEIVEMLHNASLMIDDIEDESLLRRGLPVTHTIYGVARTINTANFVYFVALEKCLKLQHPDVVKIFTEKILELHKGQGKEIFWRDSLACPTEAQYEDMVVQKTGGLFCLAVNLMQLFSDIRLDFNQLLRLMALFFQIRDDYLNLMSKEMAEQKTFAEDLSEGKFSFPIIHAIKQMGQHNDDTVLNILRQKTQNIEVKKYCISQIKGRGSFSYTLERLAQLSNEIKREIESLGGNGKLLEVISLLEESIRT
ncbi:hypothetical protein WR25_20387 [Diploscapter pachys]|uniref:RRM domain-containing protein n=1 Tax=Diploscapter pachys TaxID=2018661 RepID=A0A2A2KQ87_9BILA|nr:hypothetical protein WR25_20387 [Diploscapter pachys]